LGQFFSFTIFLFLAASTDYIPPANPKVQEKLEWWQDLKFGLMMHWGAYSQWGVVESWSICSEDQPWCSRNGADYVDYLRRYEALPKTFNPEKFDPEKWVEAAKYAGMKYVVFTTKHHDGFCMFDSKYTEYKITGKDCPFHRNPRADVTKEIFNAFQKEGFGIGAYFSKPDWNHEDYWAPEWATPNRCNNYDTRKYPERWQRFRDFTFNQIGELMSNYGSVDILWLDGGWVRPDSTITEEVRNWGYDIPTWEQDVDMSRIASMARERQPGIIIVDRSVHGPHEDYRTPEQHVPDKTLPYPWETCMTMAGSWSYTPNDRYKSSRQLIHLLVDIVAKGGNFLLNVGPDAEGEWDPQAYDRLKTIGDWMQINGEAIYATRPIAPYKEGKICYTKSKNGPLYAIYLADEDEETIPPKIMLYSFAPKAGTDVYLLGYDKALKWERTGKGVLMEIPEEARRELKGKAAWTVRVKEQ
jgi:alpha-L-fucosidase